MPQVADIVSFDTRSSLEKLGPKGVQATKHERKENGTKINLHQIGIPAREYCFVKQSIGACRKSWPNSQDFRCHS